MPRMSGAKKNRPWLRSKSSDRSSIRNDSNSTESGSWSKLTWSNKQSDERCLFARVGRLFGDQRRHQQTHGGALMDTRLRTVSLVLLTAAFSVFTVGCGSPE